MGDDCFVQLLGYMSAKDLSALSSTNNFFRKFLRTQTIIDGQKMIFAKTVSKFRSIVTGATQQNLDNDVRLEICKMSAVCKCRLWKLRGIISNDCKNGSTLVTYNGRKSARSLRSFALDFNVWVAHVCVWNTSTHGASNVSPYRWIRCLVRLGECYGILMGLVSLLDPELGSKLTIDRF